MSSHISEVANLYEKRDFAFSDTVKKWLVQVEEIYKTNALPGVTEFSTARLQITAAERGVMNGVDSYRSRRKQLASITIQSITNAALALQSLTSVLDEEFFQSKTIIRKLLVDAISSGKINGKLNDYSTAMEIWKNILANPNTSSLAVGVLERISYSDAAYLMIEIFQDLSKEQKEIVLNSHKSDDKSL